MRGRRPSLAAATSAKRFHTMRANAFTQVFSDLAAAQAAFDSVPLPVFVKDEEHRWVLVNRAFAEWMGRPPADLLGRSDAEFLPPEQCEVFWRIDDEVMRSGQVIENEERLSDAQGRVRTVVTRKQLVRICDEEGGLHPHVLAVISDVTPFREAEARARRTEARQAAEARVLELVAAGAALDEVLASITEVMEQTIPGALASVLLYDAETGVLRTAAAAQLPASFATAIDGLRPSVDAGACGAAITRREPVIAPDISHMTAWGQLRDVGLSHGLRAVWSHPVLDSVGEPLGTFAVYFREPRTPTPDENAFLMRVTHLAGIAIERARRDEQLRQMEERFRVAASMMADVVVDWDLVAGTIWWKQGRTAHTVADGAAALRATLDRIHPEDRERVAASFRATLAGRADLWSDEYRVLEEGRIVHVAGKGRVIRDEKGRPVRMISSFTDITARRELEERVTRSQRLEAVGQLTGGVAHDFNNLLTAVMGSAEALSDALGDRPALKSIADLILEAAERGSELVRQLLAFARRQPLEPRPVDCNALLNSVYAMARRTIPAHVEIAVEPAPEPLHCLADPALLTSAMLNLCINARDAMPGGGRIVLRAERAPAAGGEPAFARLSVSDDGEGMRPEVAARALEPFFTTKPPGKGSGLGLSMVYGFVTQSGGRMELDTRPGEGTTVRLYLPETWPETATEPALAEAPATGRRRRVLVVEDDDFVRAQVERQLQAMGFTVTTARNGPEALEALARLDDVELLLTDVIMPGGMNGRQLADHARLLRPGLPILYTSGHVEDANLRDCGPGTGALFLPKPYRRAELAEKLTKVFEDA